MLWRLGWFDELDKFSILKVSRSVMGEGGAVLGRLEVRVGSAAGGAGGGAVPGAKEEEGGEEEDNEPIREESCWEVSEGKVRCVEVETNWVSCWRRAAMVGGS